MAEGLEDVLRLVDEFATAAVSRADFKEDWARSEYIEPFFEALGWTRINPAKLTNRSTGFVREVTQLVVGKSKAPDYAFYCDGTRVFYTEAKKPSVNIKLDKKPAQQLRRYGWNAGHDVGLLTDFGEFAVYNCQIQPAEDDPTSTALIDYFTFTDYETRWDWLVEHFSPQAVESGSLRRLLGEAKKKRRLRPVDAAFLAEIDEWRKLLATSLVANHPTLSAPDLNYAVQAIIDRIVFLRIAEARGLEERGALEQVAAVPAGLYARLQELFDKADARYNAGLFHFRREAGRDEPDRLTPSLNVDDEVLRRIIYRLSPETSPYEFSVMPADILGSAYEQFLGHTISVDSRGRVRVEEKPEVRKAGGVYYTPSFVVDRIVRSTLGPLVRGKTPGQVAKLRVVDPACGSGSFLIAAYQFLLDWHLDHYRRGGTRYRKLLSVSTDGTVRLSTDERKRILTNNVFGVDIDPQAVEVAKLSLLLKVIEGETQLAFAISRLLPDLDKNVCCGNSLVGTDAFAGRLPTLSTDLATVNPFDWAEAFPQIVNEGGFDAVIGNPPWLMAGYYVGDSMPYLQSHYATCQGKADLYYLFLEKACDLVADDGRVGMIVPNKLFHTKAASATRELLSVGNWLDSIIDFGTEKIFEGATNYSCILLLNPRSRGQVKVTRATYGFATAQEFTVARKTLGSAPWHLMDAERSALWKQVEACGDPLEDLTSRFGTGIQTGADRVLILPPDEATERGLDGPFLRPILRGRDVRRYHSDASDRRIVFPYLDAGDDFRVATDNELQNDPRVYAYLREHKARLSERVWFGKGARELSGTWYGMMYVEPRGSFTRPHLVTPALSNRGNFAVGTGDLFVTGTAGVTSAVLRDDLNEAPEYLVAVLNSALLSQYAIEHSPPYQGGYFKFSAPYIRKLPVYRIDMSDAAQRRDHDALVVLARQLGDLHSKLETATGHQRTLTERAITAADAEVDTIVLALYGITTAQKASLAK